MYTFRMADEGRSRVGARVTEPDNEDPLASKALWPVGLVSEIRFRCC